MINSRQILIVFGVILTNTVFAQNRITDTSENKGSYVVNQVLKSEHITPQVLLGQIGANTATNNLKLELREEKFELQGVAYQGCEGWKDGLTVGVKLSGKNENKNVNVFSGENINTKFTGDVSFTKPIRTWVSYDVSKSPELKSLVNSNLNQKYDTITKYSEVYKEALIRNNFIFLTGGLTASGAKYYLIDSSVAVENMISKRHFAGLGGYAQFNLMSYRYSKKRTIFHSIRASFSKVNNISDLTEYSINTVNEFNRNGESNKVERKRTGYYDAYEEQNRAILSYEISSYNMDTINSRIGVLLGVDYLINSKTNDFTRFNAGLTFPVKFGKKRIYVAGILTSTDLFNMMDKVNFKEEQSLSFNIKLATDLRINFSQK